MTPVRIHWNGATTAHPQPVEPVEPEALEVELEPEAFDVEPEAHEAQADDTEPEALEPEA